MAYEDDRDLDLDRSLYEEDPAYEADTYFGERLDETTMADGDMGAEEFEEDEASAPATADESFGESLQPDEIADPKAPESESAESMESEDDSEDM